MSLDNVKTKQYLSLSDSTGYLQGIVTKPLVTGNIFFTYLVYLYNQQYLLKAIHFWSIVLNFSDFWHLNNDSAWNYQKLISRKILGLIGVIFSLFTNLSINQTIKFFKLDVMLTSLKWKNSIYFPLMAVYLFADRRRQTL